MMRRVFLAGAASAGAAVATVAATGPLLPRLLEASGSPDPDEPLALIGVSLARHLGDPPRTWGDVARFVAAIYARGPADAAELAAALGADLERAGYRLEDRVHETPALAQALERHKEKVAARSRFPRTTDPVVDDMIAYGTNMMRISARRRGWHSTL